MIRNLRPRPMSSPPLLLATLSPPTDPGQSGSSPAPRRELHLTGSQQQGEQLADRLVAPSTASPPIGLGMSNTCRLPLLDADMAGLPRASSWRLPPSCSSCPPDPPTPAAPACATACTGTGCAAGRACCAAAGSASPGHFGASWWLRGPVPLAVCMCATARWCQRCHRCAAARGNPS